MIIRGIYGDYYHAAAPYVRALRKALDGVDATIEGVYYPTSFDAGLLDGCDVLILCKEGVVPGSKDIQRRWMDRAGEEAVERFVSSGGMLFGWHSGLASYDPDGPIHAMYGGHFRGHPPQHEFELKPVAGRPGPSGSGESYRMSDELYRFTVESDNADIWLEGHSPEHGVQPVGWTRRHGEGTVIGFTPAHELANLLHPNTQSILRGIVTSSA